MKLTWIWRPKWKIIKGRKECQHGVDEDIHCCFCHEGIKFNPELCWCE